MSKIRNFFKSIYTYLEMDQKLDRQSEQKYVQPPPFYCGPIRENFCFKGNKNKNLPGLSSLDGFVCSVIVITLFCVLMFIVNSPKAAYWFLSICSLYPAYVLLKFFNRVINGR